MKITRRRALEVAQEAIQEVMRPLAFDANVAINTAQPSPMMQRRAERYAELAAALDWLENQARQKEMHL